MYHNLAQYCSHLKKKEKDGRLSQNKDWRTLLTKMPMVKD